MSTIALQRGDVVLAWIYFRLCQTTWARQDFDQTCICFLYYSMCREPLRTFAIEAIPSEGIAWGRQALGSKKRVGSSPHISCESPETVALGVRTVCGWWWVFWALPQAMGSP